MNNKYGLADIIAIVIYIIQVIIKLVFYVSIAMYFYNAEQVMFKIFMVAGAVLCTLITIDDVVHTVLNNFYFDIPKHFQKLTLAICKLVHMLLYIFIDNFLFIHIVVNKINEKP